MSFAIAYPKLSVVKERYCLICWLSCLSLDAHSLRGGKPPLNVRQSSLADCSPPIVGDITFPPHPLYVFGNSQSYLIYVSAFSG